VKDSKWPRTVHHPTMEKSELYVTEPYDASLIQVPLEAVEETERLLELADRYADGDIFKQQLVGILKLIDYRLRCRMQ
jgi:hypothetical protein